MLSSRKKDKNYRAVVQKFEIKRLQAKVFLHDLSLKNEIAVFLQKNRKKDSLLSLKLFSLLCSLQESNLFTSIPRNSSKTRIKNRCIESGRARSVLRFCKFSRIVLREKASKGEIPGTRKASW